MQQGIGLSHAQAQLQDNKADVDADAVTNVDADVDVVLLLLLWLPHSGASKPADRIPPSADPMQCQHRRILASTLCSPTFNDQVGHWLLRGCWHR